MQREEGDEKEKQLGDDAKNNKRKQESESDGDSGSGSGEEQNKRVRRAKGKEKDVASVAPQIDSGMFCNIPPELFLQIFKFLSSEDLISCALVCRFMNVVAADETLWRRL